VIFILEKSFQKTAKKNWISVKNTKGENCSMDFSVKKSFKERFLSFFCEGKTFDEKSRC
jgi:hypothetical protein